jgi:hypothetical protein
LSKSELAFIVLASLVKERFGVPDRSSIFRFLHLPTRGANVPKTTINTTNRIKSDRDPALRVTVGAVGAVGAVEAASGVAVGSEDGLAAAAAVVESPGGGLTVSADGLTVAAEAPAAAACVAVRL